MIHFIMNGIGEGREGVTTMRDPGVNVLEPTRIQADCVQKITDSCAFVTIDDVALIRKFRVVWIENLL
jgi:hypothetical protein